MSSKGWLLSLEACCCQHSSTLRSGRRQPPNQHSRNRPLAQQFRGRPGASCRLASGAQHSIGSTTPLQRTALADQSGVRRVDPTYRMFAAPALIFLDCAGWSVPALCGSVQQRTASLRPRAETAQVHMWLVEQVEACSSTVVGWSAVLSCCWQQRGPGFGGHGCAQAETAEAVSTGGGSSDRFCGAGSLHGVTSPVGLHEVVTL